MTIQSSEGSGGDVIARDLAARLNWPLFDEETLIRRFIEPWADPADLYRLSQSPKFYLQETSEQITFRDYLDGALKETAAREHLILFNFAGGLFFHDHPLAIHLRLTAPLDFRVEQVRREQRLSANQARQALLTADRRERRLFWTLFGRGQEEVNWHMTLDTALVGRNEAVETILALRAAVAARQRLQAESDPEVDVHLDDYPQMKNQAEREFGQLLDRYGIDWHYEPKTFPVEWDQDGEVTLAFSPDFYLPRFNLYLELTTMNQKYVTLKNKKARRLRELYPGVNVRIVYRRDFIAMMERYELDRSEPLNDQAQSSL